MTTFDKFALVTGAGSGIGRAVALGLMQAGYRVALVGRHEATLRETAALADSARSFVLVGDIGHAEQVAALFARVQDTFGRLDVLFNNAGISAPPVPIDELTPQQWQTVLDVNLSGSFYCAQAAFKLMKAQSPRGGRIINNGSVSAQSPRPNSAPYTATKHAITGLTKALSLDGRAFDIACGQIDIGNALTEMAMPMTRGVKQANGQTAVEATMDVADVVRAVLYMASLPLSANVQQMTVMATTMPLVGRG
ncbi:SDR family oxidoreductase [Roseateles koreensis]|uniref:SDR family NAD(P)-dependent oxidoreductase n=1 Tax=Roseateles koreensis TaxID=2987526 RepID=A0ABT5KW96_9BURK|nr:SDR family oxidoreductase [Roseateles koreensis]MDC8787199.1 SDR family NAD(P)-dependent oxidoreductase [Roseateles koreensis]